MLTKTVLIIEDEPGIADSVIYALKTEGFNTHWETLGRQGIAAVKRGNIDLVILDIGLPDISGLEVCKLLRKSTDVPIIFLTARGDEIDRIVGLELGGDDYMVKPFSPRELAARVKVILRRSVGHEMLNAPNVSSLVVDPGRRLVHYFGQAISFTKYEYEILVTLVDSPGRVFTREQLMESIWTDPAESFDRAVDTHIKTLRAKLREIKLDSAAIVTHRGVGYSFLMEWDDS